MQAAMIGIVATAAALFVFAFVCLCCIRAGTAASPKAVGVDSDSALSDAASGVPEYSDPVFMSSNEKRISGWFVDDDSASSDRHPPALSVPTGTLSSPWTATAGGSEARTATVTVVPHSSINPLTSSGRTYATDVPPQYRCPISLSIMQDPVCCFDGHHVFDRVNLLRHVEVYGCCPLSRVAMSVDQIVVNHAMYYEIKEWREKAGELTVRDVENCDFGESR
ncbi:hypothetical protein DIPPA_22822 [Diplonema papillatum]|nr:hypothetical protein DIPPA_22822 [Diplonema papillatum]